MIELLIKVLLAYLVGSVMGGLWLRFMVGGADIRQEGSGNAGATNALRARGKGFAAAVALVDVIKGVLAVALVPMLVIPGLAEAPVATEWVMALCGVAAVFGHVWPIWHGFRGGKGAATLVGVMLVIWPLALLPVLAMWVLILVTTGYVGLATVLAAVVAPVFALLMGEPLSGMLVTFTAAMALTIVYTHRSNLKRLFEGNEHRFEKVMLFRRRHG
ncbi:glycerol-3-phosphate 1-O-acyltransferase PlsY [Natronospira bacteriovora]|uniref:Glycerol-3-phosphate acyltransferase n=1 Tax=Natronospira bacteriovora TaxID=3069753 RepID=A0ABU0W9X5_9GAMM|nr:glycerol-3-phosphate 1-O-acyltransferase PlsY [Natronospira sp. AB-CW4]MDQ2070558.1 glycerol-3-phosphate 1-O-acyltransferase PlsY [Natronospira sp. AB-CW4]